MNRETSAGRYTWWRADRRGVAQLGSAPALGAGGPRFESGHPDHVLVARGFLRSAVAGPSVLRHQLLP